MKIYRMSNSRWIVYRKRGREFEKIGEFLNSRMLCKRMNKLTGYEELKM